VKKPFCIYVFYIGLFLLACQDKIQAQDKIHLKDGTEVSCRITEIQDFILYAEVHDDPFLATFFADDVSHLDIDPKNTLVIRQLKQGVKEAMAYSNPSEDNHLYGFYFGMPYDSVHNKSRALYKSDSLGNPILVPYDPQKTDLSDRLKSMTKSLTGNSLIWLIGGL
tara:strand:+ start:1451 stop:1948 length:498 start_codon:yes stop_codon:yes gene_type:complete